MQFYADWETPGDILSGFSSVQNKVNDTVGARESIITSVARDGTHALRLHTNVGDDNVHGSNTWERDDMVLNRGSPESYCFEGSEEYWAISVLYPDDFTFTNSLSGFDFHHQSPLGSAYGQANVQLTLRAGIGLQLESYSGTVADNNYNPAITVNFPIKDPYGAYQNITKNVWYDWVIHVKWSHLNDGLLEAWLNGTKVATMLNHSTLYYRTDVGATSPCYLKLANYHTPTGSPQSVIIDRVIRGNSLADVQIP